MQSGAVWTLSERGVVNYKIAADDEMFDSGPASYFSVGLSGLRCILNAIACAQLPAITSILDLPCGHGRVARYLKAAFPHARHTFCDINRSAVDFCVEEFGGRGVYSQYDLGKVSLGGPFDVIWVGSLFTHLPADRIDAMLRELAEQLAPGGVLVATFHGAGSLVVNPLYPMIESDKWSAITSAYESAGFGYAPYTGVSDGSYGISLAKPWWIFALAETLRGLRVANFTERGWADNHDVLALERIDRMAAI